MNEVEIVVKSRDETDFGAITSKARTSMNKSVKDGLDKVEKTTTERFREIGDKGGLSLSHGVEHGTRAVEKDTESLFGKVGRLGRTAFNQVEKGGQAAFNGISDAASGLAESGPQSIALVVGALAAVPFAATAVETAVTAGIGGALIGLGLYATKGSGEVQNALGGMTSHIKSETKQIAAPFKATWLEIAHDGQAAFDSLEPALQRSFDRLAPATSRFVHSTASSFREFSPAIDAASAAVTKLEDSLGGDMPSIVHSLSSAISIMANDVGNNSDEIAAMAQNTATLLPPLAAFLSYSVKLGQVVSPLFSTFTSANGMFNSLEKTLDFASGGMLHLGNSSKKTAQQLPTLSASASALDKDVKTLASDTASATDKANALSDAFNRLLNPAEAVFSDTAKLRESVHAMSKALEDSHGKINDNTSAARASKQAFTGMIDNAKNLASDLLNSGKSIGDVRARLEPTIAAMYRFAGSNKQARRLVDDFVRGLDQMPAHKKVGLSLDAQNFFSAWHKAQGLKLDSKTGLLKGDNSNYLNKWLKANHLRIDTKTGLLKGDNSNYYNKWLRANHLHISTKTGRITGNTSAFWSAVHSIPYTVAYRRIGVYYVPLNSANEPGHTRAAGGVVGHAAEGGPRGNMTLVGEHGPELVSLPTGSTVHSNPDTGRMLASAGGGGAVRIEWGGGPTDELGHAIWAWLKGNIRAVAGSGPDAVNKALRPA